MSLSNAVAFQSEESKKSVLDSIAKAITDIETFATLILEIENRGGCDSQDIYAQASALCGQLDRQCEILEL